MSEPRAAGVYCHWETYPPEAEFRDNILIIEKVSGNGKVDLFDCTRREADSIRSFLNGHRDPLAERINAQSM